MPITTMCRGKVLIGMSGGVDSSAAAYLLLKQGYQVEGVTMRLWQGASEKDAKEVCRLLEIPLHILDLQAEFERDVVQYFARSYQQGLTPNPCVACNQFLKFGKMLEWAREMGADYVATGHYAHVTYEEGRWQLRRAADWRKDQSYFLYRLSQEQLGHALMPLWNATKEETRAIAREIGIPVADKPDSQEICFVPDGDYVGFLEGRGITAPKGNFIDAQGQIVGQHQGLHRYTVGQRKGLGIALGYPAYITKIDAQTHEIFLGPEGAQLAQGLTADQVQWIAFDKLDCPLRSYAKIRYNSKEAACTVSPLEDGCIKVSFDAPVRAVTPGQSVVFYDGDLVLGGGVIV